MKSDFQSEQNEPRKAGSVGKQLLLKFSGLMALFGILYSHPIAHAEPALTEHQVKALFLFNFARYVEWPAGAFADAGSPITIGIVGKSSVGNELEKVVAGKAVDGRRIAIHKIEKENDLTRCHILFVSASESDNVHEILNRIKTLPVLTVGEAKSFLDLGGIINFVKKESKVRLEIDLNATRQANLQVSSKLLNVADVVRGKQ